MFRVGVWVWEAGLPPNAKPSTTIHYLIRLVGMGITSNLSVSGRTLEGWGGELGARAQARVPQGPLCQEGGG